jgi:hypothetical protein
MQITRTRWFAPLFVTALGVALLIAEWIGGHPARGLVALAIVAAFGAVLAVVRNETVRGFGGDGTDERFEQMGTRAGAFAGFALTVVLAGGVLVRVAEGRDTGVFGWLALVAAASYLVGFAWQRIRR